MRRIRLFVLALFLIPALDADAVGPRGGGNRGGGVNRGGGHPGGGARPGGGLGGGGGRPSAPMARPAQRPGGGARPNLPQRPGGSPGLNRPGGDQRPGNMPNRPNIGSGNRPNLGGGDRPNLPAQRPNPAPRPGGGIGIAGNRPGTGLPGNRPNLPSRPDGGGIGDRFPNIPGGGGDRFPNRPGGGGDRFPNLPSRPDGGGDRFPNIPGGGGDRFPNLPSRPDGGGDRFPNRPDGGGDRFPNRPDWSGGNRPSIGSDNNFWANNSGNTWNRNVTNVWAPGWHAGSRWGDGFCNGYGGGLWRHGFPPYYGGWFRGAWNWHGPTWWGAGSVYTAGFLAGDASSYYNPYYIAPVGGTTVVYNYSEPLPVSEPQDIYVESPASTVGAPQQGPVGSPALTDAPAPQPASVEPTVDPTVTQAGQRFEQARAAFKAGDFAKALSEIDAAIKMVPKDAALHEFRALCLFAQGKFQDAAGVLYSVLAVGPGWTWDTVKHLYDNPSTYEQQLKALSDYVKANPKDAASRFVLAYHSLVLGDRAEAVRLLNEVVALNPKDQLAAAMAKAIGQSLTPDGDRPKIEH